MIQYTVHSLVVVTGAELKMNLRFVTINISRLRPIRV